ncbi:hypothetical protein TRFO_27441 [Tritrichomonas foetus]|uniref:Uncharacterized protein n=1 Tax=Tritrichomonas foetus TaxID=1144522 RepID=A0A1J4K128_9EUKA|nr:hypothetical protein TRFO_27441 [Tritrichomonas foetus]|eukprot:OHT04939.1 hypothetical protein TRFO_27441 [Tritrichomonas foetus]
MSRKSPPHSPDNVSMQASSIAFSIDLGDTQIDPNVVRQRENRIVYFSDQITEQQRYYDIAASELAIQQKINQNKNNDLKTRKNDLDFRKKNIELLQQQLKEADTEHESILAKKKTLMSQINRIHQTIKTTFERIDRHVKRHSTEIYSDSDSYEEEDQNMDELEAKATEKYNLMQKIKQLKRKVVKARAEQTKSDVSKIMLKVQKCELNNTIIELNAKLESLKQKFNECDQRIQVANDKKSVYINPLTYDQEMTTQAEQLADEAERSLNRSRLEFSSVEAQMEYLNFKALRTNNKQRAAQIKVRRAKLERSIKRRDIRLKHGKFNTPSPTKMNTSFMAADRRNRSASPVRYGQSDKMSTCSRRSRARSRIERRQIRIEIEANTLDELEITNEQYRQQKEDEYREKIAKINELNREIADHAILKDMVCEGISRNEEAKWLEEKLRHEIEEIKENRETSFKKCQDIMHDRTNIKKNEELIQRKRKIERRQTQINAKRTRVEEMRKRVDYLEERHQKQAEKVQEIDQKIANIGKQIEKNVAMIKNEIDHMLSGVDLLN